MGWARLVGSIKLPNPELTSPQDKEGEEVPGDADNPDKELQIIMSS